MWRDQRKRENRKESGEVNEKEGIAKNEDRSVERKAEER